MRVVNPVVRMGVAIRQRRYTHNTMKNHQGDNQSAALSSDLVLLLRYGLAAGAENGRPLEFVVPGFWLIKPDYPHLAVDEN